MLVSSDNGAQPPGLDFFSATDLVAAWGRVTMIGEPLSADTPVIVKRGERPGDYVALRPRGDEKPVAYCDRDCLPGEYVGRVGLCKLDQLPKPWSFFKK